MRQSQTDNKKQGDCPELMVIAIPNVMAVLLIIWSLGRMFYEHSIWFDGILVSTVTMVILFVRNNVGEPSKITNSCLLVKEPITILLVESNETPNSFLKTRFGEYCDLTLRIAKREDSDDIDLAKLCNECKFIFASDSESVKWVMKHALPTNTVVDCGLGDASESKKFSNEKPNVVFVDAPIVEPLHEYAGTKKVLYIGLSDHSAWEDVSTMMKHVYPQVELCGDVGTGRTVTNCMCAKILSEMVVEIKLQAEMKSNGVDTQAINKVASLLNKTGLNSSGFLSDCISCTKNVDCLKDGVLSIKPVLDSTQPMDSEALSESLRKILL